GEDTLTNIENIVGSAFNDVLKGDNNANIIDGGKGDDLFTGLGGSDTFILRSGDGIDTITDFEDGIDFLGLTDGLTFGALNITQGTGENQNDTLIKTGNETLAWLNNVQFTSITEADFTIV
ncbi:MAG: lysophospholipase, partial [Symploca sp. SIO1C4]|nr:lysophospholipase [Symploca sp. SIO1C4]